MKSGEVVRYWESKYSAKEFDAHHNSGKPSQSHSLVSIWDIPIRRCPKVIF